MNKDLSIVITTIVVIMSVMGCKQDEQSPAVQPLKVNLLEIKTETDARKLSYSGTIEPENTALVSFAVPGVINHIAVEEGQFVNQGQLLATIDDTEYRNALAIATAGLAQAEDMYNRLNSLYKKGSLPEKDFIDIQTKVAQATANREISAKHIRDSKLVASVSGIITKKMIERGSAVAPGVPAFQIVKTDNVYARVSVPESEIGVLERGMPSGIFVKTLNETFQGNITIINPQADPVAKTYDVKVKLNNASGKLLPGMIAEVVINTGKSIDMITVPAKAIVRDADDVAYVFITNSQNKAVRKRVEVTGITGANEIIVTGLNVGDKVVVAGQSRLKEGTLLVAGL